MELRCTCLRSRGEEPVRRWGGGPIAARAKRRRDGGGCSLDVARVLPRDPDPKTAEPHLRLLPRPRTERHKTPIQTSPTPEIQSKPPGVDGAGDENGIFRGLPVEENVDSISSTGPLNLSRRLSTELQICDSELPPSKIGFYTEFTPVMKIIIFKLFCASLPSSKNRRGS